jgi:hypothetical protein
MHIPASTGKTGHSLIVQLEEVIGRYAYLPGNGISSTVSLVGLRMTLYTPLPPISCDNAIH